MPTVEIVEVSPRDGLQNEKIAVSTENKVALILRAIEAGAKRIEAASFVLPRAVPQMADGAEVVARLRERNDLADVALIGLALNARGAERALAAGVDEINFAVCATESFNQRNQNAAVAATMGEFSKAAAMAKSAGKRVSLTIAVAFGCPFEGEVDPARVRALAEEGDAWGAFEIGIADTIGVADPYAVERLMADVRDTIGGAPLRLHFHNTRNTGYANAFAALRAGAASLDSSIGGIGGCPFAPNATGNIATDDLVYMLGRMGVETGYDLGRLIDTAAWLKDTCGLSPPSLLPKAGAFPAG
ncbi:MAG: hydroxymethylglutaryl-CoA lyase [Pseudomonadota bacterium]